MEPDDEYILKYGDPRMATYPLMDNPSVAYALIAAYLVWVKFIGPTWMKDKPPYEFRMVMIVYNLFISALNAWIFYNFGMYGWFGRYRLRCEPIDFSNNEDALMMVYVCWIYFASKYIEFADTIFAVLRKKDSQVSKLHVFHHCIAPATFWYSVKYGPGGYNTFIFLLNSFTHIWMYLYYGLAAMGPSVQKYLWWKNYITIIQLIQFVLTIIYQTQLILFPPVYCKVSMFLIMIIMVISVVFFFLFMDFYFKTYQKRRKPQLKH